MYDYNHFKEFIFSDDGQREIIRVRDACIKLLNKSGVSYLQVLGSFCESGDSWKQRAIIDRLVELGTLQEIEYKTIRDNLPPTQYRIFKLTNQ